MPAPVTSRTFALIESGVVASLGLGLLLTRGRPGASRAADQRRAAAAVHHQVAFIDQDRDNRLAHQKRTDEATPTHAN